MSVSVTTERGRVCACAETPLAGCHQGDARTYKSHDLKTGRSIYQTEERFVISCKPLMEPSVRLKTNQHPKLRCLPTYSEAEQNPMRNEITLPLGCVAEYHRTALQTAQRNKGFGKAC